MQRYFRSIYIFATVFILYGGIYGQGKFEGYSFTLEADNGGACPVRYLPSAGNGNGIEVYLAGTGQRTPAGGLTACDGSGVAENRVNANGEGRWCFSGTEPFYDIKLRSGASYLWYPTTKDSGFYNVKDFRPVTKIVGAPGYTFTDPADYSKTIKNAVMFIAARQGGTLHFPEGDYIVGTLDGNRRDPAYQAITLPSGIIVEGISSNASIPTTNLPSKRAASTIRLRNEDQTIFRIGGCTNHVVVRQLELLGNSGVYGEPKRDARGNYGIEGLGKWILGGPGGQQFPNSTQSVKIENVTFQNLDKGIYVHNANDAACDGKTQYCHAWQFDYVLVDHCIFLNNKTGIWIDTYNTEWKISNSFLSYTALNAPGDGINIQKAGIVLIEQTFGGGYDYGTNIGGTFISMVTGVSLTIISSGSERGKMSIYTSPIGSITSMMMTVIGSVFGDKVDLNGRFNYFSSGNLYGPVTFDAEPAVNITSIGDRYCWDSQVLPGRCVDAAGRTVNNPGITGGRRMFESGNIGEDTGPNRVEGRPNFFGYNVQIGDGLLQFDPNITYKDITAWAAGAGVRPKAQDGAFLYCKDCRKGPICSQGSAGTDGAFAKRVNGQWRCD